MNSNECGESLWKIRMQTPNLSVDIEEFNCMVIDNIENIEKDRRINWNICRWLISKWSQCCW